MADRDSARRSPDGKFQMCSECGQRPVARGRGIFCSDECERAAEAAMGRRLTVAREALGLSANEVAARLGISRRNYLAWEQGKRKRWTHMCMNLVYTARLPVSADWIICNMGSPLFDPADCTADVRELLAGSRS